MAIPVTGEPLNALEARISFVFLYTKWCILASNMNHRTNIYLRPDQMKRLKALNQKTGAPIAELVRRAVDDYLAKRAKEK